MSLDQSRVAELAANLRAKWLTEEASALEDLARELSALIVEHDRYRASVGSKIDLMMNALERSASVLRNVNTSARNQCLGALSGKTEDEYLVSIGVDPALLSED